ncbi:MAG: hypothetical protein IPK16_28390 [Anaerolineales bacterium]|nr:hypothetical protein [Anaerolineales bacterium]
MKRVFAVVSLLVLSALLFAGCTGAVPAAPATGGEASAPAADGAPVTLTYMASQGWIKDAELELAKKFEEQTGIHIDYQIIPADQYFSVLKTKLNAGEATDIFGGQSGKNRPQGAI